MTARWRSTKASELQLLDGASPEILKAVHRVKRVYDGEVVEVDSPDDQVIPSEALWGPQACCACGQRKWWRKGIAASVYAAYATHNGGWWCRQLPPAISRITEEIENG